MVVKEIRFDFGDGPMEHPVQFFWWLFKSVCAPVTLPWLLYKAYKTAQLRSKRACLQDKVVLITGASSGIGEAIAHKFYAEGCRLILTARRTDQLNRVKDDLLRTHPTLPTHIPYVVPLDLLNAADITSTINKVFDIYGRIDILINNAGVSYRGLVTETDMDVYMKIMMTNYFSQITLTKAVLPHMMKRRSGNIVFTSSLQAKLALPCRSAYGASKHALQAFGDSLRAEVEKHNVKVSMICPAYVKTSLSMNALTASGEKYGKMDKSTQNGDLPETIAGDVMDSVINEKKEIVRGPFLYKLFYFIRILVPTLYFKVLLIIEKGMRKDVSK